MDIRAEWIAKGWSRDGDMGDGHVGRWEVGRWMGHAKRRPIAFVKGMILSKGSLGKQGAPERLARPQLAGIANLLTL